MSFSEEDTKLLRHFIDYTDPTSPTLDNRAKEYRFTSARGQIRGSGENHYRPERIQGNLLFVRTEGASELISLFLHQQYDDQVGEPESEPTKI